MDKTVLFMLGIIILVVICLVLAIRLFQYKKQIRGFTARIVKRQSQDVAQPVNVDIFDKDIVELAVALNEYTDYQKELTLQLERDREKLKHVIAGISHDFRTPLTSAYGYLQLIKKSGELSNKSEEYLDISMEKTLYLKKLSDEFFEMSAIEANLNGIELEKVHLDKLLQECILGQYDWISESGLRAEFDIPEQGAYVQSNEYYLKRIIENIFSNMRKYAETYISIKLHLNDEGICLIASNDTKCKDIIAHKVFEPFYRGESRSKEGSGLGLYVVKCLAVAMGHKASASLCGDVFEIVLEVGKYS
ncbi:MAG: HAMP domain-containing histidine kinase [Lachnospiraceae bacterium]|nr:HAMP domain-containing histidine kinase [Lachnospiraceae bacterium]